MRHPHGAVPLGAGGGLALPGRGRRCAPHPQRRARAVPLGADHACTVAARWRRRLPPHPDRPLGARRPGRGPARAACPGGAGDPLGIRRQPPGLPHGRTPTSTRVLRRLPRPRRRVRAPHQALRRFERTRRSGSRSGPSPPRRGSASPTTSSTSPARPPRARRSPRRPARARCDRAPGPPGGRRTRAATDRDRLVAPGRRPRVCSSMRTVPSPVGSRPRACTSSGIGSCGTFSARPTERFEGSAGRIGRRSQREPAR